jgi:hypothetical protein
MVEEVEGTVVRESTAKVAGEVGAIKETKDPKDSSSKGARAEGRLLRRGRRKREVKFLRANEKNFQESY